MKQIVFCFALLLATFRLVQQQEQPPPPPTPSTFPQRQTPGEMTPATHAPPAPSVYGQQVQAQILQQLRAEPSLADKNVNRRANDNFVVLTGTIDTMAHSNLAARQRGGSAGGPEIVDNIEVRHQT